MAVFPPEYYDQLDPSYRAIFQPFVKKLEKWSSYREYKDEMVSDFLSKYMVPQEIKHHYWREEFEDIPMAFYYFYVSKELHELSEFMYSYKIMSLDTEENSPCDNPWLLTFPNYMLDQILENCEHKTDKLLPKNVYKKYEQMKILYEEIMAVEEENVEKWMETLWKTEDVDFVIHNVEYRLGNEITNRKLWKLYIDFLEKYDFDILLQTFSKYCRFFMDDHEMKTRYEKTAKAIGGGIEVPWKNPFPFEKYSEEIAQELFDQHRKMNGPNYWQEYQEAKAKSRKPSRFFSSSTSFAKQNFAFQQTTVNYVFRNSDFYLRKKLLHSCKFFFLIFPFPLCYKFKIGSSWSNVKEESWSISPDSNPKTLKCNNLHITTIFSVETGWDYSFVAPPISEILPRFYKCDAKYVRINSKQSLTFDELKFLIGSGNVEDLMLKNVKCTNQRGDDIPMEDILKLTPKIVSFEICKATTTKQTSKILAETSFRNKVNRMRYYTKINELEAYAFAAFVKKNAADNCEIYYKTGSHLPKGPNFDEILQSAIDEHWNQKKEKPRIFGNPMQDKYMEKELVDF